MTITTAVARVDAGSGVREIEQIVCPFERVRAITAVARAEGTLPGRLARLRTAALHEGLKRTATVAALAHRVGMKRSRVSTLIHSTAPDKQPATTGR